jgi:hypothetical protein
MSKIAASLLKSVTKLKNDNYYVWKEEMENIFLLHVSYDIVFGNLVGGEGMRATVAAAKGLDREACPYIYLTIDLSLCHVIAGKIKASECWKAIAENFTKDVCACCYEIHSQLYHPAHNTTKPIHEYIQSIKDAQYKVEGLGKMVSDEEIWNIIIISAFDTACTNLITHTDEPTLTDVEAALKDFDLDHQACFEERQSEVACHAAGKQGVRRNKGRKCPDTYSHHLRPCSLSPSHHHHHSSCTQS